MTIELKNEKIYGKIWTAQELASMEEFSVRCADCNCLLNSESGAMDHSKTHNKFYKYDSELEKIWAQIERTGVRVTEEDGILLGKKLNEIKKHADKYGSKVFLAIKTGLASQLQMKISEKTHPFSIFFNGSNTNKEIVMNSIKTIPDNLYLNSFTPKSFVTHSARSSYRRLADIDLLPKIHNKLMITSSADVIFSGNKPTVNDNVGIIDVVLEGNGYESYSAVHGMRGYSGDYNFVWLSTINQIDKLIWNAIGRMNNKPLFFRLEDELVNNNIETMLNSLNEESSSFGNDIVSSTTDLLVVISNLFSDTKRVKWNKDKDDKETCQYIIQLSIFLSDFRAYIPTRNTGESRSGGTNYNFDTPIPDDPTKLLTTLYNLARGHAILYGRNYIISDDLDMIIHIVISSLPSDRLDLLVILLCHSGKIDTIQIEKHLSVSKATALKEMEKLRILKLVEDVKTEGKSKPTLAVQLKNKYHWIFEDKFQLYCNNTSLTHIIENSKLTDDEICPDKDNLEKNNYESV